MKPFVSVLIPTYNYAYCIERAVNSILQQNYNNMEIIIVDDGSTDDTSHVIAGLTRNSLFVETGDSCFRRTDGVIVRYFHKENSGIAASHNFCLEKAQGELIAWCDADDYWAEGKLKAQINYLAENPDCQIVYTKYDHFFENFTKIDKNNPNVQHHIDFAKINKYQLTTSLAKRDVFNICGKFREEISGKDDAEMVLRIQVYGIKSSFLETLLYWRCLHNNNFSWTLKVITREWLMKYVTLNKREKTLKNIKILPI